LAGKGSTGAGDATADYREERGFDPCADCGNLFLLPPQNLNLVHIFSTFNVNVVKQ
jgi:hypothetical protein